MAIGMSNIIGELGIKITGYTADLSSSLKTAKKELQSFGKSAEATSKLSKMAFAGIGVGVLAVGAGMVSAVNSAQAFEKGMSNISTLIDINTESMAEMSNAVLDISKRTPVLSSDLTSALYDVRSAGIDAGDAMSVLESSAQLGVAGLGSTSEAVDLVTSSINAFKLEGEEADAVYGYVFNTVKSGKTTISELAQGFGSVAGTVANANIALPEYLSAVAALTTTGMPAAQAHTQIKAAIAGVTRESEQLTTVLDNLNAKSFKDLVEKQGGMVEAFKAISEQVDGNDAAILKLFGSTEAYNAVVNLSGGLNETFVETLASMEDGTLNLSEAFEKQKATTSAHFQLLENNLNALGVQVGSAVLPALNELLSSAIALIDHLPELANQFTELVANNDWVQGALVGLGAVLTGLAVAVIPSLVVSLASLIATIAVAAAPFVVVGAAITGLYVLIKNWGSVVDFFKDIWGKMKSATLQFWDWVSPYVEVAVRTLLFAMTGGMSEIVIYIAQNWETVSAVTMEIWEVISGYLMGVWESISGAVMSVWNAISSATTLAWNSIKGYLEITMRVILGLMSGGMSEVLIYIVKNWDSVKTKTSEVWDGIKEYLIGFWEWLKPYLEVSLRVTVGILTGGLSELAIFVYKNWDDIKAKTEEIWNGISDFFTEVWGGISSFAGNTWNGIKGTFSSGLSAVKGAWENTWNTVKSFTSSTWDSLKSMVTDGITAVSDIFYDGIDIIGNAWTSVWDNVTGILDNVFGKIKEQVDNVIGWIGNALDSINIFKSESEEVGADTGDKQYAKGGYTFGRVRDVAGVVHGGEWVAPAWMVNKYGSLISQLEGVRQRGYASGGFVNRSAESTTNHNNQRTVHQNITQNIREGVDFSVASREMAWRERFN